MNISFSRPPSVDRIEISVARKPTVNPWMIAVLTVTLKEKQRQTMTGVNEPSFCEQ